MAGDVVKDLYFKIESELEREDVRAFARIGCYESLLNGVGFAWDHYYEGTAIAEAMLETGMAGVVAPTLQDVSGPGSSSWGAAIEETLAIAHDSTLEEHGIGAAWGPHATDTVSCELWRKVLDLAVEHDLPVHAHCAQSPAEYATVAARSPSQHASPVEFLANAGVLDHPAVRLLLVHNIFVNKRDLARLSTDGRHVLVACPASHMLFMFPARVDVWVQAGLPVALATDAAASNDGMCVQSELRLLAGGHSQRTSFSCEADAFLESGGDGGTTASTAAMHALAQTRDRTMAQAERLRDPRFALSTVWDTPGGLHNNPRLRTGTLAPGNLANLLVWDFDHPNLWPPGPDPRAALVLCSNTSAAIKAAMVAGKWVGHSPATPTRSAPATGRGAAAGASNIVRANFARGAFHESVLGSGLYDDHVAEATDRLQHLLRRAGIAK